MYCEFCGTELIGDAPFCPSCGKRQSIVSPIETRDPEAVYEEDVKRTPLQNVLLLLIIIMVVAVAVLCLMLNRQKSTPVEAHHDTVTIIRHVATLSVSPTSISVDGNSTTRNVSVTTNGKYTIDGLGNSWLSATKHDGYVTLHLPENNTSSSRTETFVVRVGNRSEMVTVSQARQLNPDVTINNVWAEHNYYHNGVKGMKINVSYTATDMSGKNLRMRVDFFFNDDITRLHDRNGNDLVGRGNYVTMSGNNDSRTAWLFVPYNWLNMSRGFHNLAFDVNIESSSNTYASRLDNKFTLDIG